jgi:hypothetical protein
MANELLDYFGELDQARQFAELFCMPHQHHHEKRVRKSVSGANLMKISTSSNFQDFNSKSSNFHPLLPFVISTTAILPLKSLFLNNIN